VTEELSLMTDTRRVLATLTLVALALLGAACGGGNAATITLSEFAIKTKGVQLNAGQPATLTLVNSGKIEHNLTLDPAVTDTPLPAVLKPGERTTVTFTPKANGTFEYACTIPGHAPAGMIGTVTVGT
jgi:uncharacterized cupredoxin-like copper-binding protein